MKCSRCKKRAPSEPWKNGWNMTHWSGSSISSVLCPKCAPGFFTTRAKYQNMIDVLCMSSQNALSRYIRGEP